MKDSSLSIHILPTTLCSHLQIDRLVYIQGRGYDSYAVTSGAIISQPTSDSLSLPFFCPVVKNEAKNCCDVLRNCFLKTMLRKCCAISLYQRIRAANSITAAMDLSKTHMLKRCAAGKKTFQFLGLSRWRWRARGSCNFKWKMKNYKTKPHEND